MVITVECETYLLFTMQLFATFTVPMLDQIGCRTRQNTNKKDLKRRVPMTTWPSPRHLSFNSFNFTSDIRLSQAVKMPASSDAKHQELVWLMLIVYYNFSVLWQRQLAIRRVPINCCTRMPTNDKMVTKLQWTQRFPFFTVYTIRCNRIDIA